MERRIPAVAVLLAVLFSLNACQNPSRIAPVGPAPFGDLSVSLSAPADVPGVVPGLPDAEQAGFYALAGAEVTLVNVEGDLSAALSASPVARGLGREGRRPIRGPSLRRGLPDPGQRGRRLLRAGGKSGQDPGRADRLLQGAGREGKQVGLCR